MTDNELLSAIANMLNKNSKALVYRMDSMEERLNNKIDMVEQRLNNRIDHLDIKIDTVEQRLSDRIDHLDIRVNNLDSKIDNVEKSLKQELRKINLNLEHNIEPRLRHIEECYTSTYDRYKVEVERMDKMQLDIEVMQDVIKEHGHAIEALTA